MQCIIHEYRQVIDESAVTIGPDCSEGVCGRTDADARRFRVYDVDRMGPIPLEQKRHNALRCSSRRCRADLVAGPRGQLCIGMRIRAFRVGGERDARDWRNWVAVRERR